MDAGFIALSVNVPTDAVFRGVIIKSCSCCPQGPEFENPS